MITEPAKALGGPLDGLPIPPQPDDKVGTELRYYTAAPILMQADGTQRATDVQLRGHYRLVRGVGLGSDVPVWLWIATVR